MKRLVWVTTPKDWTSADRETLKQQVVEATMNGGVIVAEEGVELDVTHVDGGLMLKPRKRSYELDELLAQIKPENLHGETDWGRAGGEAW